MAVPVRTSVTLDEFQAYIHQPENADRHLELIAGEIVDVPSNTFASEIAVLIATFLKMFLLHNRIAGRITGEGGGYIIHGDVYAPDVAYVSMARQPQPVRQGFNPVQPELAVEVISDPTNTQEQQTLRRKLTIYLTAGCIVWIVDPFARTVEVYAPGQAGIVLDESGTLTLDALLPGFTLPVKDIFPAEPTATP